jgi:transcriptional regulator with XRE-family HTH domain
VEATVIDITWRLARVRFSRPENAADLVRAARQRLGLTQEEFAQVLTGQLGWLIRSGFIEAWETGIAEVPVEVRDACRKITADQLLGEGAGGGTRSSYAGLSSAEADAREVIAWMESTNISDNVIDYLTEATIRAAEDHISLPPTVMLGRVRQLHAMATTLLRGGRQRIRQTRELLRVDAELLAHLCQLLGDVHRDRAACASGRAAMVLADEAGCSPATVFSAQAQIARWRHRHAEAADLAAEGFKRAAPPPLRVLLAYQEATAAAADGQAWRAHAAMARAEAIDDGLAPDSAWSCPPARQALYRLGVELNLGHPREVLQQATETKPLWGRERPHAFGTWAHYQIVVANAHLMLGSADGATEQIGPVLSLPSEYRLSTLVEHVTTIDTLLRDQRFNGSAETADIRAQLAEFARTH